MVLNVKLKKDCNNYHIKGYVIIRFNTNNYFIIKLIDLIRLKKSIKHVY